MQCSPTSEQRARPVPPKKAKARKRDPSARAGQRPVLRGMHGVDVGSRVPTSGTRRPGESQQGRQAASGGRGGRRSGPRRTLGRHTNRFADSASSLPEPHCDAPDGGGARAAGPVCQADVPDARIQALVLRDWDLIEDGVNPSDRFRVVVVPSATRNATSTDIDDYNYALIQVRTVGGANVTDDYTDFDEGGRDDEASADDDSASVRSISSAPKRPWTGHDCKEVFTAVSLACIGHSLANAGSVPGWESDGAIKLYPPRCQASGGRVTKVRSRGKRAHGETDGVGGVLKPAEGWQDAGRPRRKIPVHQPTRGGVPDRGAACCVVGNCEGRVHWIGPWRGTQCWPEELPAEVRSVGQDHATAEFAAETQRRWWRETWQIALRAARRLQGTADGRASNTSRGRSGSPEFQGLPDGLRTRVPICRSPPDSSKRNEVEQSNRCHITGDRRRRPAVGRTVVMDLMGPVATKGGLSIHLECDDSSHETGHEVTARQPNVRSVERGEFPAECDCTFAPRRYMSDMCWRQPAAGGQTISADQCGPDLTTPAELPWRRSRGSAWGGRGPLTRARGELGPCS